MEGRGDRRTAVASSFGAAGALAIVLLWVSYSSQSFLLGEFTRAYSVLHGSRSDATVELPSIRRRADQPGTAYGANDTASRS